MGGPPAIEAEGLSKCFGTFVAVDDVSLHVEPGTLFGFIGPNGAGKTTTIRMLLGLVTPSRGRIEIFGTDIRRDFKRAIRQMGAMVEGPAFYPFLSAHRNLRLFGGISGGVSEERIHEVLEWVGLSGRKDQRVSSFSQGMRQRLGIALALLERPRLLILDEPTNGLDPQGTREIRDLIRRIRSEEETTVLLSSHLLAEMELICDRVAILSRGKILTEGTLDSVIGHDTARVEVGVREDQGQEAVKCLRERFGIDASEQQRGWLQFSRADLDLSALNRVLVEEGIQVSSLVPRRRSLEEAFVEFTGESSDVG
ncbi:ABC transporter ATP-binding protein [Myxococcota bacterium]|nr:ABC transporter ATP-binding protein [Myxococcota bacterium]